MQSRSVFSVFIFLKNFGACSFVFGLCSYLCARFGGDEVLIGDLAVVFWVFRDFYVGLVFLKKGGCKFGCGDFGFLPLPPRSGAGVFGGFEFRDLFFCHTPFRGARGLVPRSGSIPVWRAGFCGNCAVLF